MHADVLATRHVDEAAAAAGLHHAVAREKRDGADRVLARLDLLEVVERLHAADLAELTREKDEKSIRKFCFYPDDLHFPFAQI